MWVDVVFHIVQIGPDPSLAAFLDDLRKDTLGEGEGGVYVSQERLGIQEDQTIHDEAWVSLRPLKPCLERGGWLKRM